MKVLDKPDDFHQLSERIALRGQIITRTGLRVGSGGGGAMDATDLPVLRDGDGAPMIPGGSLKGVLRSTLEALVRAAANKEVGLWACDPLAEEQQTCGYHKSGARKDVDTSNHCALCRLFGSRVLASHVRITDALLNLSEEERESGIVPVEIRDGVAIDRDLRRVYGGQKYDFEVVSPGAMFNLEIFIENPQPWLMGLLVIGLDQISDGFTALGGFSSRGLGRVELKWHTLSRVRAAALLAGGKPEQVTGAGVEAQFQDWRRALADHVTVGGV